MHIIRFVKWLSRLSDLISVGIFFSDYVRELLLLTNDDFDIYNNGNKKSGSDKDKYIFIFICIKIIALYEHTLYILNTQHGYPILPIKRK